MLGGENSPRLGQDLSIKNHTCVFAAAKKYKIVSRDRRRSVWLDDECVIPRFEIEFQREENRSGSLKME